MSRSHEHIEGLLGRKAAAGSLSEGFRDRVAQGVSGSEPGALPVGNPVLPASAKGAITLAAVGLISAGVWFAVTASPDAPGPQITINPSNNQSVVEVPSPDSVDVSGVSAMTALRKISEGIARGTKDKTDLFSEGRRLIQTAAIVSEAFVSVFPREWTELLWGPSPKKKGGSPKPSATPSSEPLQG